MKRLIVLSLSVTVFFLAFNSCQKKYSFIPTDDNILIERAKAWFQKYKEANTFNELFTNTEYQWGKATTVKYANGYKLVLLPIKEIHQNAHYNGVRLLHLYPLENNNFYTSVVEFIPDLQNLNNKRIDIKNFTGYINSWSLKKGFVNGGYLKNAIVEKISKVEVKSINTGNPLSNTPSITNPPIQIVVVSTPNALYQYMVTLMVNGLQIATINQLLYGSTGDPNNVCEITGPASCGPLPWELDPNYLYHLFYDDNGYLHQRKQELGEILANNKFALEPCDSLNIMPLDPENGFGRMWQSVAQYQIPDSVENRIDSVNDLFPGLYPSPIEQQTLQAADGPVVNCDFYPVRITQMPTGYTAQSLLEYFRLHISDSFSNPSTTFTPYQYSLGASIYDTARFFASYQNSVGALIHINITGNDGTVIESKYNNLTSPPYNHESHQFIFTTLHSPLDWAHPVAGNRAFGIYNSTTNPNEFTFYTMGVDRVWDYLDAIANESSPLNPFGPVIFNGGDALWSTMQTKFMNFINSLPGGQASFYSQQRVIARPPWVDVKEFLEGTIDWITLKQRLGC